MPLPSQLVSLPCSCYYVIKKCEFFHLFVKLEDVMSKSNRSNGRT